MYARVIVEIGVKAVDRMFTYLVPDIIKDKIKVGARVKVPFGKQFLEGFVLELTDICEEDVEIKEIMELVDESKIDSNVVTIGSIVKVNDMDFEEEVEYTIVGSAEADPYEGKISNESPVGKALLGRTIGDVVDVQVPDGVAKFEILEIRR